MPASLARETTLILMMMIPPPPPGLLRLQRVRPLQGMPRRLIPSITSTYRRARRYQQPDPSACELLGSLQHLMDSRLVEVYKTLPALKSVTLSLHFSPLTVLAGHVTGTLRQTVDQCRSSTPWIRLTSRNSALLYNLSRRSTAHSNDTATSFES